MPVPTILDATYLFFIFNYIFKDYKYYKTYATIDTPQFVLKKLKAIKWSHSLNKIYYHLSMISKGVSCKNMNLDFSKICFLSLECLGVCMFVIAWNSIRRKIYPKIGWFTQRLFLMSDEIILQKIREVVVMVTIKWKLWQNKKKTNQF